MNVDGSEWTNFEKSNKKITENLSLAKTRT